MPRLKLTVVLLIAAFLAAEPALHVHQLVAQAQTGDVSPGGNLCAACAAGPVQTTVLAPAVFAPLVAVCQFSAAEPTFVTRESALPLASRAPPAAG